MSRSEQKVNRWVIRYLEQCAEAHRNKHGQGAHGLIGRVIHEGVYRKIVAQRNESQGKISNDTFVVLDNAKVHGSKYMKEMRIMW